MGEADSPPVILTQESMPGAAIMTHVSMAAWVMRFAPATDAEALKLLRGHFPDQPLSLRVAALDFLMRRRPGGAARSAKQ